MTFSPRFFSTIGLFIVLLGPLRAQSFSEGFTSGHENFNLAYGYFMPDMKDMRAALEATYHKTFFDDRLYCAGYLTRRGTTVTRGGAFDSHGHVLFMIPQNVQVHDSLRFKLGGWQVSYGVYGKDLLYFSKIFDLILSPGVAAGQFRMSRVDDDRRSKYANPFVCVKGTAEARICIKKFSFGARGEYLYDITDPKWKRKNGLMPVLPGSYNRGWLFLGFLGWAFGGEK